MGAEVEFDVALALETARAEVGAAPPLADDKTAADEMAISKSTEDPRIGVINAWFIVQKALFSVNTPEPFRKRAGTKMTDAIHYLIANHKLRLAHQFVFESLQHLRNQVMHEPDLQLTWDEMRDYAEAAFWLSREVYAALEQLESEANVS